MPAKLPISVCLISGAEAARIGRTLASVSEWTSEIVVVLNEEVQDETEKIAVSFGAKIFRHPWQGFREQKNLVLQYATQPWVLNLDADEEVSPELRASIFQFFQGDYEHFAGADFARKVWFMGRWITHGDWYPDRVLRLFQRGKGCWGGSPEHCRIELQGAKKKLPGDLLHYTNPNINSYVQKINYFADIFLQRQLEEKVRWCACSSVFRSGWRFLRAYFSRRLSRIFYRGLNRLCHARAAQPALRAFAFFTSGMRAAQISLIISTYEKPAALEKVLQGVARQSEMPGEILIADDGSKTPTRDLISEWQKKIPTQPHHIWHEDAGFRKTIILNKSVAAAKGDYIVLLDGDCVPHAKFISDHAMLAEKNFWVQGRRCFIEEKFAEKFSAQTSMANWILRRRISGVAKSIRLPWPIVRRNTGQRGIIGCNMGFWRDDLFAVNGFDEEFTGWGIGEDSDIGTRLYHLGRPRKFVYGHAIVFHLNHPMLGRAHFEASRARLAETIRSKKIRCERGLRQYL